MRLPALLPKDLARFNSAEDAGALFDLIKGEPLLLQLRFFEFACDDETWCQQNPEFIQLIVEKFTEDLYQDRLKRNFALQAVRAMQKHFHVLKPFLPFKLIIVVEGKEFHVNSLMVGTCSERLFDIVKAQCNEKGEGTVIPQQDIKQKGFAIFKSFIETGYVRDLWRYEPDQLFIVMEQASVIDLMGLIDQCADILKRYLTKGNVIDMVLKAQVFHSLTLRNHCADFLQTHDVGVLIHKMPMEHLGFKFLEFTDNTLKEFDKLKKQITHLSISGRLNEELAFSEVVNQCPNLIRLDLGSTEYFSRHLEDIPKSLDELDLSMCSWLTDENLKKMVAICPNIRKLLLMSNVQITHSGWPSLCRLKGLEGLDISRCHQVGDREFKMILTAQPDLKELRVEECVGLSDQAFNEIAFHLPHLTILSVARCAITDGGLIEIASRCPALIELDATRCEKLTLKGFSELLRLVPGLQSLTLSDCNLTGEEVEKLQKMRPYLKFS